MALKQPKPSLDGIRAKLGRAEEHLADLNRRIAEYLDSDPCQVVLKHNPYLNRWEYRVVTEKPPSDLSLIIGDFIHDLRCVLDYLAWQLVIANRLIPSIKHPRTQFPIHESPTTEQGRPRLVEIAPGVDPRALALVESYQPYHGWNGYNGHPLAVLRDLSNTDKHRTLNLTAGFTGQVEYRVFDPGGLKRIAVITEFSNLTLHQVVEATPPQGASFTEEWYVEEEGTVYVIFDIGTPAEGGEVSALLHQMLDFVRHTVVAGVQPFLDQFT